MRPNWVGFKINATFIFPFKAFGNNLLSAEPLMSYENSKLLLTSQEPLSSVMAASSDIIPTLKSLGL